MDFTTPSGQIIIFVVTTLVITYGFSALIIYKGGIKALPQKTTLLIIVGLMWIPGLVSIAYRYFGKLGFDDIGLDIGDCRFYFLAIGVPLFIAIIANLICWFANVKIFHLHELTVIKKMLPTILLVLVAGLVGAFGEELGWRGFLIPKIYQIHSHWLL